MRVVSMSDCGRFTVTEYFTSIKESKNLGLSNMKERYTYTRPSVIDSYHDGWFNHDKNYKNVKSLKQLYKSGNIKVVLTFLNVPKNIIKVLVKNERLYLSIK